MMPVHVKVVTFDAGYEYERKRIREVLELGRIYTLQSYEVGRSSSTVTLYDFPFDTWNSVFFEMATWEEYLAQDR